jgi:hypothetical protein
VRAVLYRGDSIALYDAPQRRVSVFNGAGRFGRSFRVDSLPRAMSRAYVVSGVSEHGDLVLVAHGTARVVGRGRSGTRTVAGPDTITILRLDALGRTVWASPPLENAFREVRSTATRLGTGGTAIVSGGGGASRSTQRLVTVALGRRVVYHYAERTNQLHIYDRRGTQTVTVQLPGMPPAYGYVPGQLATVQTLAMLADSEGRVWLEVPRSRAGTSRHWWILDERGTMLGLVATPSAEPLTIGNGELVSLHLDQDGVEFVHLCTLRS